MNEQRFRLTWFGRPGTSSIAQAMARRLPDWLYSRSQPVSFPLWLLMGDEIEIEGQTYRFPGFVRRFDNLVALQNYLAEELKDAPGGVRAKTK